MKVSWPVSGEEGQGDSQSDLPASPVFSDSLQLKRFNMSSHHIWG